MPDLEFLFHPQSIAIVGTPRNTKDMIAGASFLNALLKFGYKGDIYPVNPKARQIHQLEAYPSILSVPQTPDYVISCLSASLTPQLVKDCAVKGVKAISMYTAGFSETGQNGEKLQRELSQLAHETGVRLIGPNCLGIYCPGTKMSFSPYFSQEVGRVGLLCQSGGHSLELTIVGGARGIRFSKVISYGNAVDLNEADFLEYLSQDDETEIIGAYIEGIKDGRRFFKNLAQAAKKKPVILLKGGRTKAGMKAACSHTGSLAAGKESWDALCRQAGALQVYNLEEMLELIMAFLHIKPPKGRRVGIIGGGGGISVLATDECESAGLTVPSFSHNLIQKLKKFSFEAGTSVDNPIDSPKAIVERSTLFETIQAVAGSGDVDLLLIHVSLASPPWPVESGKNEDQVEAIVEASKSIDIPMALALRNSDIPAKSALYLKLHQRCVETGLAVYPTIGGAAQAIGTFTKYHDWKEQQED
ncbi:acetate--CoA ligase family protein [Chloroflexota bacterium]